MKTENEIFLLLLEQNIITKDSEMPWIIYDDLKFGLFKYRRKEYIKIMDVVNGVLQIDHEQFWRLRMGNYYGHSISRGGPGYDHFYLGHLGGFEVSPYMPNTHAFIKDFYK